MPEIFSTIMMILQVLLPLIKLIMSFLPTGVV